MSSVTSRRSLIAASAGVVLAATVRRADACCPAPPSGQAVVNADQSVIIIWDAAKKMQHFIRRASFKSKAADFGFLVPTPAQPELSESGDAAFPFFQKLTEPEEIHKAAPPRESGCSPACADTRKSASVEAAPAPKGTVSVLDEKTVAGFHASVLEASSTDALVGWLKDHGYAFSPEVEAWAKPYVEGGWKITALRVAKDSKDTAANAEPNIAAAALRLSFKTDRPLFPYREPDSSKSASTLGASNRLLRIYFVGDLRYEGELTKVDKWSGKVAWAGKLQSEQRKQAVELLKLPEDTGPNEWFLTEFEDPWPYRTAPADLYFAGSSTQDDVRREPIIRYGSVDQPNNRSFGFVGLMLAPLLWRFRRRLRDA